jgi:acyl-[acyl-carrier-protein] desaturase
VNHAIESRIYDLYLQYFHKAEKHRRWNLIDDIPWQYVSRNTDKALQDLIQGYMAVEMYLPDYTSKMIHLIRQSRGRAWFQANWGYEESKHSLALEMWLTNSGSRTYDDMRAFEDLIFSREYDLPYDSPLEMLVYQVIQEFATGLNYRGLRKSASDYADPALDKVLALLARDETAHFEFFKDCLRVFMDDDRDSVVATVNQVIHTFRMPAENIVPKWPTHATELYESRIFNARVYFRDVVKPVLRSLGISQHELKEARKRIASLEMHNDDSLSAKKLFQK